MVCHVFSNSPSAVSNRWEGRVPGPYSFSLDPRFAMRQADFHRHRGTRRVIPASDYLRHTVGAAQHRIGMPLVTDPTPKIRETTRK